MTPYISLVLNWILLLALFPLSFFWLRNAWRILVRRDFSNVALRRGESPAEPERWAPFQMALDGIAGTIIVAVIVAIAAIQIPYEAWTAIAGSTIWCKFFFNFVLARHAHRTMPAAKA